MLAVLGSQSLFSQEIRLTFTGTGEATAIDSVRATNLSTGQSITIPGGAILVLGAGSGTGQDAVGAGSVVLFPNPFSGETNLALTSAIQQSVVVFVRNMAGQLVVQEQARLDPGTALFSVAVRVPGFYTVTVSGDKISLNAKMLCTGSGSSSDAIRNIGTINSDGSGMLLKTAGYLLGFSPGDIIEFAVMSGNKTTIFTDSPAGSHNYPVELVGCSDNGGNSYPVVMIGDQTWMGRNLAYLPSVSPSVAGSWTLPYYYVYDYEGASVREARATTNFKAYGVLYNWAAAQTACPDGWHLPGDSDWITLEKYLGMNSADASAFGWRNLGSVGGKLKEAGMLHWFLPNTASSNTSGFTALPSGYRGVSDGFFSLRFRSYYWLSTQGDATTALYRGLYYEYGGVDRGYDSKILGFSVRCLKNGSNTVLLPTVSTHVVTGITQTTATCGGDISDDGGAEVTTRGVCWNLTGDPVITDNKTNDGSGMGSFVSAISGLTAGTPYFVRAYAVNSAGTAYGESQPFTTTQGTSLPVVTTGDITGITKTNACGGGNVLSDGGANVIARGICWNTGGAPSLSDNHTTDDAGIGAYQSCMNGLTPGTPYFVRAYATNSVGTAYGQEKQFTTVQDVQIPAVTTTEVTDIKETTVACGGNVTSQGGASVTARGVCWNLTGSPTIADPKTSDGSGAGAFTSSITGLTAGTPYYVRAYATNSGGTAYGEEKQFTTALGGGEGTFQYDNRTYTYKTYGTQTWMTENLAYLPTVSDLSVTSYLDKVYYVYDYDKSQPDVTEAMATTNYLTYGVLYNWAAAQTACPSGWHLPSDDEWEALEQYFISLGYGFDFYTTGVGKAMASTSGWTYHADPGAVGNDPASNNRSGFNILPAGYRAASGGTYRMGDYAQFWSSSEFLMDDRLAWARDLYYNEVGIYRVSYDKRYGFSIRCIRD
jgi:uncharacterized protein (TIGR02145 family)